MAAIRSRKDSKGNTSYQVTIRIKGFQEINKSFQSKESAELYAWYKESLLTDIKNFEVPKKELLRLKDVIEMKIQDTNFQNSRQVLDLKNSLSFFSTYYGSDSYIENITYERLHENCEKWLTLKVQRGGTRKNNDSGKIQTISPFTIRRHLANLSTSITNAREKGFPIYNFVADFMPYFTKTYLKDKSCE